MTILIQLLGLTGFFLGGVMMIWAWARITEKALGDNLDRGLTVIGALLGLSSTMLYLYAPEITDLSTSVFAMVMVAATMWMALRNVNLISGYAEAKRIIEE